MSDIVSKAQLIPGASQLPVSMYFDEKVFEQEKRLLFDAGPGYVGHELMVPEVDNYRSLEWLDHAKLLFRSGEGIHCMSNVCRRRQAIMLEAEQAAYMETAVEDDEIAERMDRGRRALMLEGRNDAGPYQSPFEDGMQHFHEFYRRIMTTGK